MILTPDSERYYDPNPHGPDEIDRFAPERIKDLVDELFQREGIDSGQRFVAITVSGESPYADIGRAVENQVFVEEFGNDEEEMKAEYAVPYDNSSTLMIVVDQEADNMPVGCLRLIANGENGIKTINDVASERWGWQQPMLDLIQQHVMNDDDPTLLDEDRQVSLDNMLDAGTLAVLPEYRAGNVSTALYHAALQYSLDEGIRDWVMIIDYKAKKGIQTFYSHPLQAIEGLDEGPYLGSERSQPMYLNIRHYFERLQRENPTMPFFEDSIYGILHDGQGGPIAEGFDFSYAQRILS